MKLFCFVYTVYPTGDLGGSIQSRQEQVIIVAGDEEEAKKQYFPPEFRKHLIIVRQSEIRLGRVLFRSI